MNRAKAALALGALLTLIAAMSAVTASAAASAAPGGSFSLCDPLGDAAPGSGITGRGGPVREPDLGEPHADLPASAKGRAKASFGTIVPVYFHVITSGSTGNLTNAQIAKQIDVLNTTFAGKEGGDDTGFSFALADVTRTDNSTWFESGPGGAEKFMKSALKQGGANALNFYSTTAGDFLGWSYLPSTLTKPGQSVLDGVVIDWETIPGTSDTYAGKFDLGETATHEVGHWLNLEHTFYRGCGAHGDYVADTPPEKTATSGCPTGKDTCSAPGLDPIHNYMDYSFDTCYTEFSAGQSQRMGDAWLLYRAAG
jgi:Pregnancy-associated plasma protein-A